MRGGRIMWGGVHRFAELVRSRVERLVFDEDGQDLAEYAFLTAFIGLSCVAAFGLMENAMATGYANWDAGEQAIWEPPPRPVPAP